MEELNKEIQEKMAAAKEAQSMWMGMSPEEQAEYKGGLAEFLVKNLQADVVEVHEETIPGARLQDITDGILHLFVEMNVSPQEALTVFHVMTDEIRKEFGMMPVNIFDTGKRD